MNKKEKQLKGLVEWVQDEILEFLMAVLVESQLVEVYIYRWNALMCDPSKCRVGGGVRGIWVGAKEWQ